MNRIQGLSGAALVRDHSITLKVDGILIFSAQDATYGDQPLVGIEDAGLEIQILKFTVYSL